MPRRVMWLFESTVAWIPTTAFILSSATVVAGLFRSTFWENPRWQDISVDLEPDRERRRRVHALLDDLVHVERVGPELLVTKRIEAEDALALGDRIGRASQADGTVSGRGSGLSASAEHGARRQQHQGQHSTFIDRAVARSASKALHLRNHTVLAIPGALPAAASPTRRTTPQSCYVRQGL